MRLATAGIAIALQLIVGVASASDGKGDTGGKGGLGPGTTGSEGRTGGTADVDQTQIPSYQLTETGFGGPKPWQVGASLEYHHLLVQNDTEGLGAEKNLLVYYVYGRYDITDRDRVTLRGYLIEHFLADPGETGVRTDDITLSYTRYVPLPSQFDLFLGASVSAPTSFASQLQSLITDLRYSMRVDKQVGYFSFSVRNIYDAFIVRYATEEGGNPNPKFRIALTADAEFQMPFHPALSIGASLYTGWTWYYYPQNGGSPNIDFQGVVQDSQFNGSQPVQQSYGGEVYIRYTLPDLYGLKTDVSGAYATGDPTLGYNSVIHDGVAYAYPFFFRLNTQVYFTLNLRY